MAYSNGRIYVDTSVTPNIGVSILDLQRCFAVVIEATIDGQTVRRLSSDLGVICTKRTGDTFTVDGVTWRVTSRREINPWARYKTVPCLLNGGNNVARMLTEGERTAERYGLKELTDNFTADQDQEYEDYANELDMDNPYSGISMRDWVSGMWARMTDFVKSDNLGGAIGNKGYDHNARPTGGFTVTVGGVDYTLQPLIPEGQRSMTIPAGSTSAVFSFPDDSAWIPTYMKYVKGELQASASTHVTIENEEWLTPMDLVLASTNSHLLTATSIRRGIAILYWQQGATPKWKLKGVVWSYYQVNNVEYTQDFDLTDGSTTRVTHNYNCDLTMLQGEYLIVELWTGLYSGSREFYPILGLAYKIDITRTGTATGMVDVDGVLTWVSVTGAGLLCFNVAASALGSGTMVQLLRQYYTALSIVSGGVTANLLDSAMDYRVQQGSTWCSGYVQIYTPGSSETTLTLTATKTGGTSCQQTLTIQR